GPRSRPEPGVRPRWFSYPAQFGKLPTRQSSLATEFDPTYVLRSCNTPSSGCYKVKILTGSPKQARQQLSIYGSITRIRYPACTAGSFPHSTRSGDPIRG